MDAITTLTKPSDVLSQNTTALLVFQVADQSFALNVHSVDQVILMLKMTRPPHLNRVIEGIANIHGKAVPVINARCCFGLPEQEAGMYTPIILVKACDRQVGLTVDEVVDVFHLPEESVTSPEAMFPEGMETPMVTCIVYLNGRSVLVLDPDFLLHPSDFSQVELLSHENGHGNGNGNGNGNGKKRRKRIELKKPAATAAGKNGNSL